MLCRVLEMETSVKRKETTRMSEILYHVLETETNVNGKETALTAS